MCATGTALVMGFLFCFAPPAGEGTKLWYGIRSKFEPTFSRPAGGEKKCSIEILSQLDHTLL